MIKTQEINFKTGGPGDIIDITSELESAVRKSCLSSGTITAFVPGSTGGITTIEYEPGLLKDLPELMEKLVPSDRPYEHDNTWHDGNGFSHLCSGWSRYHCAVHRWEAFTGYLAAGGLFRVR